MNHSGKRAAAVLASIAFAAGISMPTGGQEPNLLLQGQGSPAGGGMPSAGYDATFASLAGGDFRGALERAGLDYRGGMRAGAQRWIDSIASATAIGECHYELGSLRAAVPAFEEAMLLMAAHPDWLLSVQFPDQRLRPLPQTRTATWGRSGRGTVAAAIPGTMSIRQAGADPNEVLQKGGVLSAPVNYVVRPQEIMRALVIAIYRHGEILGELSRESPPLDALLRVLLKRPAPPAHYSQVWIDVALGMVSWSQGKHDEAARRLSTSLLVENQFDHPLTSWALIALGRIALDAGRLPEAIKFFEEATFVAADYGDARALEEAFRLAFTAHMAAGSRGVPPSIAGGAEWARGRLPVLHARLMAMQAEMLALDGDTKTAGKALAAIDGRLLRGDPGRGLCGMEAAYATAITAYHSGDVAAGDQELARAISIAQPRNTRLYQTASLVERVLAGSTSISDRRAHELFQKLLGDPPPRSFTLDPLGMLASITAPRSEAFEIWTATAARRGTDAGLLAAESTLRSRWLAAQPLGGRRTAIESLLGTAPEALSEADATQRAGLLARHPKLAATLDRMAQVRTALSAAALAGGDEPAGPPPGDAADWKEYLQLATARSAMVSAIAAGREPTGLDFPPLVQPADLRARLQPGQALLSFHWSTSGLTGIVQTKDRVAAWDVEQPGSLTKEIVALAKAMCLFDPLAPVSTERLLETDWRSAAERVERLLFANSKIDLGDPAVRELVIVPDGLLWYVPFELLPVGTVRDQAEVRRLRDAVRVRYCPTPSLAVAVAEPLRRGGATGIFVGKMFRADKSDFEAQVRERFSATVAKPVFLTASSVPAALAGSLVDGLVVFEEIAGEGPIAARPLVAGKSAKLGMTFGDWTASPRKRAQRVVLPGFQSAAAHGLTKIAGRPGDDLFVAVMDLLSAGSRTAVVSRWRMGGKTALDLVQEFVGDLDAPIDEGRPAPAPAESWRRAVDVVTAEQPDISQEPRVKQSAGATLPDARHPFFWAGYIMIDCGTPQAGP
jgi:tetratricopeptide (TPR) repeat protein